MAAEITEERKTLQQWQAHGFRLTAFPSPTAEIREPTWWETVVGEPPDNRASQPKAGVMQEQGQLSGGNLTLIVQPFRIDWLFNAPEVNVVLGDIDEALNSFTPLMNRWLEIAPLLQRIAFGVTLRLPVEGRAEGYRVLSNYLPSVRLDAEGSTEFLYQINRPRSSNTGVEGLKINRLSKWMVEVTQQATYTVIPGALPSRLDEVEKDFYAKLEIDVNTSPDFNGDLPADQLHRIYDELVIFAKEMAHEGDIP